MLNNAWLDVLQFGLIVKMVSTAVIVIGISWAVNVFGPAVGGALAGLPIVLGPGFYFLAQQHPVEYVSQAAHAALAAQCASQLFLLSYLAIASTRSALPTLLGALPAWIAASIVLQSIPMSVPATLLTYGLLTLACRRYGRRFLSALPPSRGINSFGLVIVRGLIAGLLVAGVTTASQWLDAGMAGALMAFPIGYTVVAVTLHQLLGRQHVIAALYSGLLGTVSLAAFCTVVSATIVRWPQAAALSAAVGTSVVVMLCLLKGRTALALLRRRGSRAP